MARRVVGGCRIQPAGRIAHPFARHSEASAPYGRKSASLSGRCRPHQHCSTRFCCSTACTLACAHWPVADLPGSDHGDLIGASDCAARCHRAGAIGCAARWHGDRPRAGHRSFAGDVLRARRASDLVRTRGDCSDIGSPTAATHWILVGSDHCIRHLRCRQRDTHGGPRHPPVGVDRIGGLRQDHGPTCPSHATGTGGSTAACSHCARANRACLADLPIGAACHCFLGWKLLVACKDAGREPLNMHACAYMLYA